MLPPTSDPTLHPDLRGAHFSPCRTWRYSLYRTWDVQRPRLACIGLNPSTADEQQDDPTVRRVLRFARERGYGGLTMLNLFAYRATQPRDMMAVDDPVGPLNNHALVVETAGLDVLCAWGVHGGYRDRATAVRALLREAGVTCFHLGLTQDGEPKHPLYLAAALPFTPFEP